MNWSSALHELWHLLNPKLFPSTRFDVATAYLFIVWGRITKRVSNVCNFNLWEKNFEETADRRVWDKKEKFSLIAAQYSSMGCFFEIFFSQIEIADIGHSVSNSSSNNEQISCSSIKSCGKKQFRIEQVPKFVKGRWSIHDQVYNRLLFILLLQV